MKNSQYNNRIGSNPPFYLSVCILLFIFVCLIRCSYPETTTHYSRRNVIYGKASYYGPKFHGKKTASGEIFDQNAMTAAHKSLPFGTVCRVTNRANKKSVIVRINDRGPFVGNRILDLSYQAMKMLDGLRSGVINARIEIIK
jgi:rare lipoprotein A